jgi:hypothetical protein
MAGPAASRRRFVVVLLLLLASFAASSYRTWENRAAWHVVRTIPGTIQSVCDCYVPVPVVDCPKNGTLYFADTDESYELPPGFRGRIRNISFPRTRAAFLFSDELEDRGEFHGHCWNMAARREVPIPPMLRDNWSLSSGGTRILAMDVRIGEPQRFLVMGLDGSLLHERILPPLPRLADEKAFIDHLDKTYRFSGEGNYLVVHDSPEPQAPRVRVLEMATKGTRSFDDTFVDITDDGLLWLIARPLTSDGGGSSILRAVQVSSGRELWRAPIPGGIQLAFYLGRNRLVVQKPDESVSLIEGSSGRWLFDLERAKELCNYPEGLEIREAGSRTFLLCWGVWDFETGRLFPAQLARFPAADFFDDGRRALRPGNQVRLGSRFAEIVDVDTGKTLFQFDASPTTPYPVNARRAGERVMTETQDGATLLWERRHPEGWIGQLRRPELLVSVFLGAAVLVLWLNRPRPPLPEER